MKKIFLCFCFIASFSCLADLPPFDHKIKIEEADQWTTVTEKTVNFDDVRYYGKLTESNKLIEVNVADNNDALPASVYWRDEFGIQHLVILREKAATVNLVVPAKNNIEFISLDGIGDIKNVEIGDSDWVKLNFSVDESGSVLIKINPLEGNSYLTESKWNQLLSFTLNDQNIYRSIGSLFSGYGSRLVRLNINCDGGVDKKWDLNFILFTNFVGEFETEGTAHANDYVSNNKWRGSFKLIQKNERISNYSLTLRFGTLNTINSSFELSNDVFKYFEQIFNVTPTGYNFGSNRYQTYSFRCKSRQVYAD